MTINKQELILQLKDFLGDLDLPDNQEIKDLDPEELIPLLTDALSHEGLENNIDFAEVAESSGYFYQITYYSQAIKKTIILDTDDYLPDTIEALADYIVELNTEADKLEKKLLTLNK